MTSTVLARLAEIAVVPVVVIDDARHARPVAVALAAGGIPTAEVTLRTDAALDAVREMSAVEGFVVGAGTVLTPTDAAAAARAGAEYLVSPGLDESTVLAARDLGLPIVPGVATATEVQRALSLGVELLKVFPAGVLGGRRLIDAWAGPFPDARFLPSGGVSADNAADYLASPSVVAVSGSWMVPRETIAAGDFATITRLALETRPGRGIGPR